MNLQEAEACYVEKSSGSKPSDNRAIRTYLKKRLREKAEVLLSNSWSKLIDDYRADFEFVGSPSLGTATLVLKGDHGCSGSGSAKKPDLVLAFLQRDLFEE